MKISPYHFGNIFLFCFFVICGLLVCKYVVVYIFTLSLSVVAKVTAVKNLLHCGKCCNEEVTACPLRKRSHSW